MVVTNHLLTGMILQVTNPTDMRQAMTRASKEWVDNFQPEIGSAKITNTTHV